MNGTQAGSILVKIVDGTREALPDTVKWSLRSTTGAHRANGN